MKELQNKIVVSVEELRAKLEELKAKGFKRPVTIIAVDHIDEKQIEVIYVLNNIETNEDVFVSVRVPRDDPRVPSVTDMFPGFRRRELEARDLMGVEFEGLEKPPKELGLERFLLQHDRNDIPPLRKDYIPPARRKR